MKSLAIGYAMPATVMIIIWLMIYPQELLDTFAFKNHASLFDTDFNLTVFIWAYVLLDLLCLIYIFG